ncbi:primosomal protein N' [Oenococcus sp.]|uniref:primosomal protein N' n=1 Tax=Oenococcus sp. TaxID=1979414 RepID=UPI0039E7B30E
MKTVSVIVDLPTKQTNQPFTYLIPQDLIDFDLLGHRVRVPFGKRDLMGFVVAVQDISHSDYDLKEIHSIIDEKPLLNKEMLALSDWLARYVFSYRIQVIQAMLPNAFKAKYLKGLKIVGELPDDIKKQFFLDKDEINFLPEQYDTRQLQVLNQLISQGKIVQTTTIAKKNRAKTVKVLSNALSEHQLTNLLDDKGHRAAQKKLLAFLQQHTDDHFQTKELAEILDISPASLTTAEKKGWLTAKQMPVTRNPVHAISVAKSQAIALNPDQEKVFQRVAQAIDSQKQETFLLEGITGSGKTEVYLQLIEKTIAKGRSAILLVPEIALTPQMIRRVKARFSDAVALIHSGLSDGQRLDQWEEIRQGQIKIVIGTRSAIFAPLDNIGLIIIDEEHESNYKQEDNPRYHARDVALWRARFHGAVTLLGSATPSLESRARAQRGLFTLLHMDHRAVSGAMLPTVSIVDMREVWQKEHADSDFSPDLLDAVKQRLATKEQTILLLNRRGYSSFVMCRNCGYVPHCPNCNLSLTLHMDSHSLKCHYCGYETAIPTKCPVCGSSQIRYVGSGTEKIEAKLQALIPNVRITRLDQDTTRKKGSLEKILRDFGQQKYDVLLGTQMVAKGLDFPEVTLVGVLNADTGLNLPDYRSGEKTFDLLTQVAGRSGRSGKSGQVIIQTFNPDNYAIQYAAKQDYEGFYKKEMSLRHLADYSPYFYTLQIAVDGPDQFMASQAIDAVADFIKGRLAQQTIMLGPTPKAIAKLRNRYYFQIILKYKKDENLERTLTDLQSVFSDRLPHDIYLSIDRDPVSFI